MPPTYERIPKKIIQNIITLTVVPIIKDISKLQPTHRTSSIPDNIPYSYSSNSLFSIALCLHKYSVNRYAIFSILPRTSLKI